MFKMFKFDKRTPEEKDMDENREEYDEYLEKEVEKLNKETSYHLDGSDVIEKEDVIRNDAEIEDKARDLLHAGGISEKDFNKMVNNLLIHYKNAPGYPTLPIQIIEGEIAGQNIYLYKRGIGMSESHYIGSINGKPLSEEETKILFIKLRQRIEVRDEGLYKLQKERIHERYEERDRALEEKKKKKRREKNY